MLLIGDIHGKITQYLDLLDAHDEPSIQLGDFGMGFLTPYAMKKVERRHSAGRDRFIRGNHDDPSLCREAAGWIEDGYYDEHMSMMCVGGAWSIDAKMRRQNDAQYGTTSWWEDEELSSPELTRIHALFEQLRPRIMLTHDCPTSAARKMFFEGNQKHQYMTRTAAALEAMLWTHQPDLWVFGHWHQTRYTRMGNTEFVCLGELEHMTI